MVSDLKVNAMSGAVDLRKQARDQARSGDYNSAVKLLELAVDLEPRHVPTRVNLGASYQSIGRYNEALEHYNQALLLDQNRAEIYSNRSICLVALGCFSDAIDSARTAVKLNPNYPQALNNLGAALHAAGDLTQASECFRKAIQIRPDYTKAIANLGLSLQGLGLYWDALQQLEEAFEKDESLPGLHGALVHLRMRLCDWRQFESDRDRLVKAITNGRYVAEPFATLGVIDDPAIHRQASAISRVTRHQALGVQRWSQKITSTGKIKIGYFSADFSNHATTHLLRDLIELHDKNTFEVIGFSLGPTIDDAEGRRIRNAFDVMIDLHDAGDSRALRLIRDQGIDIAIDLKGYTQDARPTLFEHRAAPIQVSFLGYPGTMASPTIDYLIADRIVIPQSERPFYDEKIVYLPGSYQVNSALENSVERRVSRESQSLPSNGVIFCCFNNPYKITPEVFSRWMRILDSVPKSVMWLLADNEISIKNLRSNAVAAGVNPSRLVFAPRVPIDDHLLRHRLADLFLDTAPCNAHTTASDALRSGVPVVTLAGRSFQSRVSASLLESIGMGELVTTTATEYERLAVHIAKDLNLLKKMKDRVKLGIETSALFKPAVFARNLEKAFAEMVAREARRLPPSDIYV